MFYKVNLLKVYSDLKHLQCLMKDVTNKKYYSTLNPTSYCKKKELSSDVNHVNRNVSQSFIHTLLRIVQLHCYHKVGYLVSPNTFPMNRFCEFCLGAESSRPMDLF